MWSVGASCSSSGHVKAGAITALARPRTSFTNWVDDFGQFLVYLGVLVASGLAFFLAFILRGGEERRRLRRWTYVAAAVGIVGMVVTGAAQSALTGGGFSAVTHWSIDTQSFGGKFGEQCAAQLVGLAACLRLAAPAHGHEPPVRRLLRAPGGGGRLRALRPRPRLAGALAEHSGRHRARGLRRHVGRRPGRAGHRAAQPDTGGAPGRAIPVRWHRTARAWRAPAPGRHRPG